MNNNIEYSAVIVNTTNYQNNISKPNHFGLEKLLVSFGPMPKEALLLGIATDDLPVLLNLYNPLPGPLLIAGDPGSGKTRLLQTIAMAAGRMHLSEDVQFGVLTNHPDEWMDIERVENCVGIFPAKQNSSEGFIQSLAAWAHGNKSSTQTVLLLLDNLELVTHMQPKTVQDLRWLLLRGPSRRVWPIITLSTINLDTLAPWLDSFHTRIFGKIKDEAHSEKVGAYDANLESLQSGLDFKMWEEDHWLRFWMPTIEKE